MTPVSRVSLWADPAKGSLSLDWLQKHSENGCLIFIPEITNLEGKHNLLVKRFSWSLAQSRHPFFGVD